MKTHKDIKLNILVVDDEKPITMAVQHWLESTEKFNVFTAYDGLQAFQQLQAQNIQLILSDLKMPKLSGIELLEKIQNLPNKPLFIAMSAFGSTEDAINAIQKGAADYITKPFSKAELLFSIQKNIEREKLKSENESLRQKLQNSIEFEKIVSNDPEMKKIFQTITRIANHDIAVLIIGESGTGKELVAHAIHNQSHRRDNPFIAINCAAIPNELLESELFGYSKGAFTNATNNKTGLFLEANKGTLFLDEIASMQTELQVKILRAIEEKKLRPLGSSTAIDFDTRIISASQKPLTTLIEENNFRADLYYRLSGIPITLPPLRNRITDIPLLINYFTEKFQKNANTSTKQFSTEAIKKLLAYPWPGNVRQLKNFVQRQLILTDAEIISTNDLTELEHYEPIHTHHTNSLSIPENIQKIEKTLIAEAMRQTNQNQTQAAKLLQISRRSLVDKLKIYNL